jgi:pyridinium-3,5-biscarboxylic acid mononucleotide synthase
VTERAARYRCGFRDQQFVDSRRKGRVVKDFFEVVDEVRALQLDNASDLRFASVLEINISLGDCAGSDDRVRAEPFSGGIAQIHAPRVACGVLGLMADDHHSDALPDRAFDKVPDAWSRGGIEDPCSIDMRLKALPFELAVRQQANGIADVTLTTGKIRREELTAPGDGAEKRVVRHERVVEIEADSHQIWFELADRNPSIDNSIGMTDANLDHARHGRTGIPEVVFAEHKTLEQVLDIVRDLVERHGSVLATRVPPATADALDERFPAGRSDPRARCFAVGRMPRTARSIAVVCAGTSDLPVADEAAFASNFFGHDVVRQTDVGVAGLHRVLADVEALQRCDAVIVVAGMEGALPSVVAGLVRPPVIAVPTSVGYGANFQGISALLAMLTACAPGIAVVNINNGFGAAAVAHKIAMRAAAGAARA